MAVTTIGLDIVKRVFGLPPLARQALRRLAAELGALGRRGEEVEAASFAFGPVI